MSLTWFRHSAIILLFTKLDLFVKKVKEKSIKDYSPDYTGPSSESYAGLEFFEDKLLSLNQMPDRSIETFCADITDTESFKPVLQSIMERSEQALSSSLKSDHGESSIA